MREAAGLPSVKPDGTPYLRGPYRPRGSLTAAASARKDTLKKKGKHLRRSQKRMVRVTSGLYRAPWARYSTS